MHQGFVQYLADASPSLMPRQVPRVGQALIKHSQSGTSDRWACQRSFHTHTLAAILNSRRPLPGEVGQ
jgi:hypothetical protein